MAQEAATGKAAAAEEGASRKDRAKANKKRRWRDAQERTVYLNQLPYQLKEGELYKFLTTGPTAVTKDEVERVRMLNDVKGKFKGVAIVEFKDVSARDKALALDKSEFKGRAVNVSKCDDKQAVAERRRLKQEKAKAKEKAKALLSEQDLDKVIKKVNKKTGSKGMRVRATDFDAGTQALWRTCTATQLESVLTEYSKLDPSRKLDNRNAFMISLMKKVLPARGSGGGAKAASSAALTAQEVRTIIASSSAARRGKKLKDGTRLPDIKAKRAEFNDECVHVMQGLAPAALRRSLAEFFRSPGADAEDQSSAFISFLDRREAAKAAKETASAAASAGDDDSDADAEGQQDVQDDGAEGGDDDEEEEEQEQQSEEQAAPKSRKRKSDAVDKKSKKKSKKKKKEKGK